MLLWFICGAPTARERAMRDVYVRREPALEMAMRTPDDTQATLEVHERTLAALRSGDDGAVATAMDEHLALLERIYEEVAGRSFARRSPLAGAGAPPAAGR